MKPDPEDLWSGEYAEKYEAALYGKTPAGYVMRRSHEIIEKRFGPDHHFSNVLEVGAGSGGHLQYVRHSFDKYYMSDRSPQMLRQIEHEGSREERCHLVVEDAENLSFPDDSFDRLIASHVLEHLNNPHKVLREWHRVVTPGGIISIVLPCDPGILWRLGRHFGPRRTAKRNGLAYDCVMALEHINSITNLLSLVRYYFDDVEEYFWPSKVGLPDLNLIYAAHIRKPSRPNQ